MSLLLGTDYKTKVAQLLESGSQRIVIFSAFIKKDAFLWLCEYIPEDISVHVIARWQKRDLIFGASDLSVYEICKDKGWNFGIDLNLHGKLYLIDDSHILLGSANLTHRGLNIAGSGNLEFGALLNTEHVDITKLEGLLDSVTWIDDPTYLRLVDEVRLLENVKHVLDDQWSREILKALDKPVCGLWISELVFCSPVSLLNPDMKDHNVLHDLQLLNLEFDNLSLDAVADGFKRSRQYFWLIDHLEKEGQVRFGRLSELLHSAILDDPAPYRREVKDFVQIMYEWFRFLPEVFRVTKHNVSESVSLKKLS